jgi:ABC-type phosphate transport system permease subunit
MGKGGAFVGTSIGGASAVIVRALTPDGSEGLQLLANAVGHSTDAAAFTSSFGSLVVTFLSVLIVSVVGAVTGHFLEEVVNSLPKS